MNKIKTVLCIDDSRVSRMKFRQLILQRDPDWAVVEAATGEEGLEIASQAMPDLITVDVNMPGMGGFGAVEQLRLTQPQATIVLLSANIQDSLKRRADDLGVPFVEKPITEASVARVLAFITG
jgi:CheY-like chemotaxis protein